MNLTIFAITGKDQRLFEAGKRVFYLLPAFLISISMYGETDQFGNKQLSICSYEPCSSYFLPKKRFAQKYCCESCRVMAYRDRKLGGKVNLAGVYKKATNEDVIQRINRLENNALIGGGIVVLLQVIQLVQSGNIQSITKEQRDALNYFKEEAKKNKDLNALFSSLTY